VPDTSIPGRQPVHTVYGGAHLFRSDTPRKLGAIALAALRDYAPDGPAFGDALGIEPGLAAHLYPRVAAKLEREPVEDYRIDFEDGFGRRPDDEEDQAAKAAADQVAAGLAAGTLPRVIGIRIKPLDSELGKRGLRTFDLFLTRLLDQSGGILPRHFVVTLPKIVTPEQVGALAAACDALEKERALPSGSLAIELMVETPRSIVGPDGRIALPAMLDQGRGRVVGLHFGPYDYTAACGVTAGHQDVCHPACEFARQVMQVVAAGTAVRLSDGPTTVLPIGPHRGAHGALDAGQRHANVEAVRHAWRLHAGNIRRALVAGFYQGWDLHPAQLPVRYATVYAFFHEGLDVISERLRRFVAASARPTSIGNVFDDAATAQGLLHHLVRAVSCGAITEEEAVGSSGLTAADLRSGSLARIAAGREMS
jgi:citrate lyase beta subunit